MNKLVKIISVILLVLFYCSATLLALIYFMGGVGHNGAGTSPEEESLLRSTKIAGGLTLLLFSIVVAKYFREFSTLRLLAVGVVVPLTAILISFNVTLIDWYQQFRIRAGTEFTFLSDEPYYNKEGKLVGVKLSYRYSIPTEIGRNGDQRAGQ